MSEFPQYSEQEVLSFSVAKQEILFKEARRQRASKSSLLASLLTMHELKEASDKQSIISALNQLLQPHFITKHTFDDAKVNDMWSTMRKR